MSNDTGAPVRNLELKTITGERAPIIEQREVNLRLGNMLVVHTVYVVETENDVSLRIDFVRKYGCVIDPVNNLLRLGEKEVMLEDRTEDCTIRCRLICLTDIKIPPMAEIHVPAACLLAARTVVNTANTVTSLRIMNVASSSRTLVGEPIACIRAMKVVDCDEQLPRQMELPTYLHDLCHRASEHLDKGNADKLKLLLCNFQDVFSRDSSDVG
ncbi:hypothetical protein CBL_21110, partial [Carabus blaptoides fortunei]